MTKLTRRFYSGLLALLLAGHIQLALADIVGDTEKVLNWAEKVFPDLFPSHQVTQTFENWRFRYYPETGIYAGISTLDMAGYVMGGAFGDAPNRIGPLVILLDEVARSGENGSIAACDTSGVPEGMIFRQNGNVVDISTNGCIVLPEGEGGNLCEPPEQLSATGIHLFMTTEILESNFSGVIIDNPMYSGILNQNPVHNKTCMINAPAENTDLTINFNVCYDMTAQFQEFVGQPGITINPPVTQTTRGSSQMQIVQDCLATDADTVFDAFTNETWIRNPQTGNLEKLPTF
mgnify:CR=1 FL=1